MAFMGLRAKEFEPAGMKTVPQWRRSPATVDPPNNIEDFINRSNAYFEDCADTDSRPTITGYSLAVGLPGPTSLIRLGQRIPQLRYAISRCLIAIAAGYEDMIGYGNAAGPLFMLKNIPDFDPDEGVGAPPVQFFNDRKEILLTAEVIGAARADSGHDKEDPVDAYVRLIKKQGFIPGEEAQPTTVLKSRAPAYVPRRVLTILSEGWEDE